MLKMRIRRHGPRLRVR